MKRLDGVLQLMMLGALAVVAVQARAAAGSSVLVCTGGNPAPQVGQPYGACSMSMVRDVADVRGYDLVFVEDMSYGALLYRADGVPASASYASGPGVFTGPWSSSGYGGGGGDEDPDEPPVDGGSFDLAELDVSKLSGLFAAGFALVATSHVIGIGWKTALSALKRL